MAETPGVARGERVFIRPPVRGDAEQFTTRARESRPLHHPWVHPPVEVERFEQYLDRFRTPANRGFLVCRNDDQAIVGFVNVNNIVRGGMQSGDVGYAGFVPFTGAGYLTQGLQLVVAYAFSELKLHRLEANVQPGNQRSLSLARRCGFRLEGYSPGLVRIDGKWCDHFRFAITVDDWHRQLRERANLAGTAAPASIAADGSPPDSVGSRVVTAPPES